MVTLLIPFVKQLRIDPIRIFFSILFNLRFYRTFYTYGTYRKIIVRLFPRFPRRISFVAYLASFVVTSAVSPWNIFLCVLSPAVSPRNLTLLVGLTAIALFAVSLCNIFLCVLNVGCT